MKTMEKETMLERNKVHRVATEREILERLDQPFLPTLYGSFQTAKHVCFVTDFCQEGELYDLLEAQPEQRFEEATARFYAAEILLTLEYLHCQGVIYRDLKPENVLLTKEGHVLLTDFDFDLTRSNSFVGTEENIAPEIVMGSGHTAAVDWWAFGIFLYEMLYGSREGMRVGTTLRQEASTHMHTAEREGGERHSVWKVCVSTHITPIPEITGEITSPRDSPAKILRNTPTFLLSLAALSGSNAPSPSPHIRCIPLPSPSLLPEAAPDTASTCLVTHMAASNQLASRAKWVALGGKGESCASSMDSAATSITLLGGEAWRGRGEGLQQGPNAVNQDTQIHRHLSFSR